MDADFCLVPRRGVPRNSLTVEWLFQSCEEVDRRRGLKEENRENFYGTTRNVAREIIVIQKVGDAKNHRKRLGKQR